MGLPGEQTGGFTYADYLMWPEEERWELIEGVAWSMSPAPGRSHQRILLNLARLMAAITDSGPCETYVAPFDVRLAEDQAGGPAGSTAPVGDGPNAPTTNPTDDAITTVVQPDISVFCRPEILDEAGARGAPDLVVEILSPSTSYKDQTQKLSLYERHGVKEYWIVNAEARWVMIYHLGADRRYAKPDYYRAGPEGAGPEGAGPEGAGPEGAGPEGEVITSAVLGGATIPVDSFL